MMTTCSYKKGLASLGMLIVALLGLLAPAVAAQGSAAISQAYQFNGPGSASNGTLLSLAASGQSVVIPANRTNTTKLVGVAISNSLLEFSGSNKGNAQVAVGGSAQTLVSDIDGTVKVGDKITASPVSGIGMKAVTSGQIVGIAESNLTSVPTVSQTVAEQNGKTRTIKVGLIQLQVDVSYYTAPQGGTGKLASLLPPFLQSLANAVSGKQVSPLRVLSSAIALFVGFITVMVMLYSSIRANIASIGRNPLAEAALRKGFAEVFAAAMCILVIAIVATYFILTT